MFRQERVMHWLTAGAIVAALACMVGLNARAVYAACATGCHLGDQAKIAAQSWKWSATTVRDSFYTTGTTGGTKTITGATTAIYQSYYTAECPDKTYSWCSAVSSPMTTTVTSALGYCAGS